MRFRTFALKWVSLIWFSLFAIIGALELGAWHVHEEFHGPFPHQADFPERIYVPIGQKIPVRSVFSARGNREGRGDQSDLRMRVNGEDWGPQGLRGTHFFTHWHDNLYFTLPAGTPDDGTTVIVARYSVRPHAWLSKFMYFSTALVLVMLTIRGCLNRQFGTALRAWPQSLTATHTRYAVAAFPILSVSLIAVCMLYLATILWGLFAGDALPTATIFRIIPGSANLSDWEPLAPLALLLLASLGAAASWLGEARILDRHAVRRNEITLLRLWSRWGLVCICCLLIFSLSAGGWSGRVRMVDATYFSMAGLIPHSDAFGYLESFYNNIVAGDWGLMGARRPMAQALRDALILSAGYSVSTTLVVQTILISVALYFAAFSLARWRGVWAGLAFLAIIWMIARPFLSTTLTEPIGLIITLGSLPFMIEAIRRKSVAHASIALAALSAALLARMGSLFLIPFMMLWLPITFEGTFRGRVQLFLIASACVITVLLSSALLSALYSPQGGAMAGNFVWTLCGLSVGGNWSTCWNSLFADASKQYPGDEGRIALIVLSKTFDNVRQHPLVFLASLQRNVMGFLVGLPRFFLDGYISIRQPLAPPETTSTWMLMILLLPGLVFVALRRMSALERIFWTGLCASTTLSAAIIFADDGWRVLIVTNALFACFFAFGFVSPATVMPRPASALSWKLGALLLVCLMATSVVAPGVARTLTMRELRAHPTERSSATQQVILGGPFLTGFLIVPDDQPRSFAVPSLPWSQFVEIFTHTQFTDDPQPLLARARARVPFAFVVSPISSVVGSWSGMYYIAPPEVLEQSPVRAWALSLAPGIPKLGAIDIRDATSARPLQ
jgi:hypothetical protein